MRWPWHHRNNYTPDPEKAETDLRRVKARRPAVERLVADLRRERHLNSFTANANAILRGGRQ